MIPATDTEHQFCIGNLHRVHNGAFTFESVSTIASSFGNSTLVDFVQTGQNNVVLAVYSRIPIVAVGVFTGVYLFENVSVVEIVYFWCSGG